MDESRVTVTSKHAAVRLPAMGCGTWAWGNRFLWGYRPEMDVELRAVFNFCVRHGITLFDTGDSYGTGKLNGRSEQLLGQFSRDYSGPYREDICLATKLAAYPWRLTRQAMVKACEASMARLGRPVDLVQMHWPTTNYAPWQEGALLEGLADAVDRGLAKAVGLSNYGPQVLRQVHARFRDRGLRIATLQVQYSLISTYVEAELEISKVCQELGIQLIAYSPLGLGLLTGKYSLGGQLPKGTRGWLFRYLLPGMQELLGTLQAIATERGKTMAQVAINWCLCRGTIPIPGAKTLRQAEGNFGALGWRLTAAEVEALDRAAAASKRKTVQNPFQTR